MKKKIIVATYILLILLSAKLLYNTIVNNSIISQYSKGKYSERPAKMLTYFNFPQSYIAYYNYGNILYQNGKYKEAIEEYKKALEKKSPKEKECKIRINYALAICKTVQVDENNQESIANAIKTYESAIEILTQKGCANKKDNNGHSPDAQKLKNDIQKEIDRLKKLQQNDSNSGDSQEEKEEKDKDKSDSVEEKMQEIKEESKKEQRKDEGELEKFTKKYTDKDNKNW